MTFFILTFTEIFSTYKEIYLLYTHYLKILKMQFKMTKHIFTNNGTTRMENLKLSFLYNELKICIYTYYVPKVPYL